MAMDEIAISNLNGYLHALRRLSGNACDFWAEIFPCIGDVEGSFRNHLAGQGVSLVEKQNVRYREIDEILEREIFSKLVVEDESLLKLFAWDIVEFIELAYIQTQPETSPISNKQAFVFKAKSEFHGEYVYLVVPVNDQAISIGLASRAQASD